MDHPFHRFLNRPETRLPSHFFYGDGTLGTDLNATFAAQTLVHIDRLGFAVFHLEYRGRATIYAFALAIALAFIYRHLIHVLFLHLLFLLKLLRGVFIANALNHMGSGSGHG